ncbi:MAG: type II toxin-antitoxin system Phd/YefM family antitoxin [Planctomycetes bacterium]|nr:type II toxin-antitoxin system Phd/YefM family antitoxin [Planctomycetota bacterium]
MIHPSDIHTLTEFKRNSSELIERLEASGRPQVLTVEGRPKVVVLCVDAFERLAAHADLAQATEGVRRGLEDVKAGRTMSLKEFEAKLRQRLGRRPKA